MPVGFARLPTVKVFETFCNWPRQGWSLLVVEWRGTPAIIVVEKRSPSLLVPNYPAIPVPAGCLLTPTLPEHHQRHYKSRLTDTPSVAQLPNTLPFPLSNTTTFRLSSWRSSGLMTLSSSADGLTALLPLPLAAAASEPDALPSAPSADGPDVMDLRCLAAGAAGKLCFLSMASTVRWKRRKRDSARMRVEGRSMVLDSSLTERSELAKGEPCS